MPIKEMKQYAVILIWPGCEKENIEFHVLETDAEQGTEEFDELMEQFQDNNNTYQVLDLTQELIDNIEKQFQILKDAFKK